MMPSLQELTARFAREFPPAAPSPAKAPAAEAAPAPAETAAPASTTPPETSAEPVQSVDYGTRGYHLDIRVAPDQVMTAGKLLDEFGFAIDTVTGVDWIAEQQMEVVYDFFHPAAACRVAVRTRVPRDRPELPTLSTVFPGANWHERETHDFFGIRFLGHPDLSPFLLPEDATYHPLKKDFTA